MNYADFIHVLTDEMASLLGDRYTVRLDHQHQNNEVERDVLLIMEEGQTVAPVIDIRPFYEEYSNGMPMVDILTEIHMIHIRSYQVDLDVDGLESWESVRYRIGGRLVSADNNPDRLERFPHRRFLDLALIYDIHISGEKMKGSAIVTNENLELWGVTEEALYHQSRENLPNLLPPCIYDMEDMMRELLFGEKGQNLLELNSWEWNDRIDPDQSLYVITNTEKYHGAVTVLYESVLDRFMDRMGWRKIYLIPSSVHEMILMPMKTDHREGELLRLIREVNEECVSPDDILTDSLYCYERHNHVLSRVRRNSEEAIPMYGVTIL